MDALRVKGKISDSVDDGKRPLSTPLTTLLASNALIPYLDRCITDEVSTIVSTVRKGSWIIEDYLRRSGKIIPHFTTDERLDPIVTSGTVLIFDDSIHTGESVLSAISNLSKNQKIKICCILINEDAKNQLIAKGLTNIQYYRIFKRYTSYVKRNGYDQELSTDCQSYCYSHFLIPYISGLTYNYSPDYTSILIKIGNDSSTNLDKITTVVLESVKDLVSESFEVYRNQRILRTSSELHENYLANIFKQLIFEDLELDMGKLRMTVVVWKGYAEIVVTPIISCRIKSNVDYSEFLYKSSKKILNSLELPISEALVKNGFPLMEIEYFGEKTNKEERQ